MTAVSKLFNCGRSFSSVLRLAGFITTTLAILAGCQKPHSDHEFILDVRQYWPDYFKRISSTSESLMNWKLDIPVSYQAGELGEDEFVGGFEEKSLHRLTLYMIYEASGTFRPSPKPEGEIDRTHGFFINLRNKPFNISDVPFIKMQGAELQCLRSIDVASMQGESRPTRRCPSDGHLVRCNVDLNYKGWDVDIRMPKKCTCQITNSTAARWLIFLML